jgi:hypothetical protein
VLTSNLIPLTQPWPRPSSSAPGWRCPCAEDPASSCPAPPPRQVSASFFQFHQSPFPPQQETQLPSVVERFNVINRLFVPRRCFWRGGIPGKGGVLGPRDHGRPHGIKPHQGWVIPTFLLPTVLLLSLFFLFLLLFFLLLRDSD